MKNNNEISRMHYSGIQYNMNDICNEDMREKNAPEIDFDKSQFDILNNKALSCISKSHVLHDELETYYISAMNFDIVNELYEETVKKISSYIKWLKAVFLCLYIYLNNANTI